MTNTIKALYRYDTWPLTTSYESFNAYNLTNIWRNEYESETWIHLMWWIYNWKHKITRKWKKIIYNWNYIAEREWHWDSDMWLLFVLTNANANQILNYVFKTRNDLWENYDTYIEAFYWGMTDEIWNTITWWFSTTLTV